MKKNEPEKEKEKFEAPKMRYRYYCHGCTNDAIFSPTAQVGLFVTCGHCGKQQVTQPENWLPL